MFSSVAQHVRHQLVGYIALFVALGGVSYAAVRLPAHSVGPKQIKNGAVGTQHLRNGAVNSSKVKEFSLLAKNFKPGQLPSGARGPQGPQGAPGAQGVAGQNGTNGANGADGTARAYGYINADGTFDPAKSKNVTASTRPFPGVYCVTVANASPQTEGAAATPDYHSDNTTATSITHIEWRNTSPDCGLATTQFEFIASKVTANGTNLVNTQMSEPFFFVVP